MIDVATLNILAIMIHHSQYRSGSCYSRPSAAYTPRVYRDVLTACLVNNFQSDIELCS